MECITSGPMGTWILLLVPAAVGIAIGHWCHPIRAIRRAINRRRIPPYRFGVDIVDRATPTLIETAGHLGRLHRSRG